MKTNYKCKLCGHEFFADFDPTVGQEDFDKLFPMLTCDRCYDMKVVAKRVREDILHLCARIVYAGMDIEKKRDRISELVRQFAAALHTPQDHQPVIDQIIKRPALCWQYLSQLKPASSFLV